MSFGVTSAGFVAKRLADILSDLTTIFQQRFGSNFDLSNDSPEGQFLGTLAERELALWELADLLWQAGFAATAGGFALDLIYKLVKLLRLGAAPTTVLVNFTGTNGTYSAGSVTAKTSDTGQLFTNTAAFTITGGVATGVLMTCSTNGPTLCLAGTLTVLVNPPAGVSTIINPLDGTLGRNPETDADFRLRRDGILSTVQSASAQGLALALAQVANVTEVRLVENLTDYVDAFGRPGHSFEAVILGGADSDLAQAIWKGKPSGIQSVGSTQIAVTDPHGDVQQVAFSRPIAVPCFVKCNLLVSPRFPVNGISLAINALVQYGATLKIGQELDAAALEQAILDTVIGIKQIDLFIGKTPSPASETPIGIEPTQIISLDSTRMQIARTN